MTETEISDKCDEYADRESEIKPVEAIQFVSKLYASPVTSFVERAVLREVYEYWRFRLFMTSADFFDYASLNDTNFSNPSLQTILDIAKKYIESPEYNDTQKITLCRGILDYLENVKGVEHIIEYISHKEERRQRIAGKNKTIIYLHGFMSGANGAKQRQLQQRFGDRYKIIAPELDADPDKSLDIINRLIGYENPELIVGSSLGGWMALMCESRGADVIIVNPCLFPGRQLSQWVDEEHRYFCRRLDGVQTYTLTQKTLDLYKKYDTAQAVTSNIAAIIALCSSNDELLGDSHINALTPLLPENQLTVVDDFGHQCNGEGLKHLFKIIEDRIKIC